MLFYDLMFSDCSLLSADVIWIFIFSLVGLWRQVHTRARAYTSNSAFVCNFLTPDSIMLFCSRGFSRAMRLVCHCSQHEPTCRPAQTEEKWSGEDGSSRAVCNADSQGLSHNKQQQYAMDVCSGLAGLHPGATAESGSSVVPDCAHMQKARCRPAMFAYCIKVACVLQVVSILLICRFLLYCDG